MASLVAIRPYFQVSLRSVTRSEKDSDCQQSVFVMGLFLNRSARNRRSRGEAVHMANWYVGHVGSTNVVRRIRGRGGSSRGSYRTSVCILTCLTRDNLPFFLYVRGVSDRENNRYNWYQTNDQMNKDCWSSSR